MNSSLPDAKSIFGRAAEISTPGERAAFLDDACAGHPAVRAEVETLLKALGDAGSFMRSPAAPAGTADYGDAGTEGEGTLIGPYTLREQIGEGGMGLVFVAEQQQPVRRKVALKVIKPGMDTRQVVARFEAERQALALMDHPNIAKVFDAGVTDAGRPYFVMELVKGAPITEYADANNLTPKDRLGLFVQVCQAVQHAHQKGVIHRDLKPSNILVAPHDGIPVVKVIDFGVAKALGQSLTEEAIYTRFAQMIGTPLYMSPEQAEVNQLDVDTRSDVYSLGVLLYELLTGTTPFDGDRFHKAAFDEIRRIIKEEEPPRPSTRLTSLGVTLTAVSAKRGTDPGQLAGLVRGELDWIVMRCLEKDRTRRYDTAIGLAKDVERYLNGDAVEACPPTLGYRLTKAYRKHRNPIRVGLAFALLFALGTVVSIVSAVQARRAERIADQRRAESEENARVARENGDRAEREAENVRAEQDRTRRLLYASQMSAASAALADNRIQLVVRKLEETTPKPGEPDLRGWEWHYLDRLTRTGREYTLDSNPFDEGNPAVSQLRRTLTPNAKPSRWLVTSRPHGAGDVYVIVDALSGQRVAQVPKDSAIARPAKASGLTWRAVVSDDGRYLLLTEMPASFESKVAAKVARLRAWEIATGQEVVGLPDAIPVTYAVNRGPILGPDAAWVAWVERPGLNLSDENSRPDGGMGLRPNGAAGPVEIAVCRWERGVGMLPPKKFSVGTGTGALSLAPDGRTVFWLPAVPNDISIGARSGPLTFECWDTAGDPKRRWSVEIPGVRNSFPAYRRVVTRFSPSRTMVGFHNQGDMVIHRIADASIHWRVPLPASLQLEAGGLQYYVSDDGNRVVICGEGTITVLEKLGKSPTARPVSWSIHYRPGWDIWDPVGDHSVGDIFQLLPDGQTLIGFTRSGATVRVWDVARDPQGGPVATALPEPREPLVHGGWPMTERATADGRITVRYRGYSRSDRGLPVGQAPPIAVTTRDAEGKEIGRFELPGGSHPGRAPRIDFVDNDRRLLVRTFQETTDEDPQLRTGWKGTEWALYDLETPGRVDRIAGGSGFFFPVPNSAYLVNSVAQYAWTTDAIEIRIAHTGRVVQRFFATGAERFYVTGDMFDPTAERFIRITTTGAAESDGPLPAKVEVFETATGKRLWSAELGVVLSRDTTRAQFDGTGSRVRVEYRTEKGHYLRVAAAADGSHAKTLQLGTAEFHRIPNGPIVPDFRNHTQIQAVAPNSRYAAVLKAGGMDLWDLDSGERLHHLIGFEGNAIEAVFNPDGTRLFCHVGRGASATAQHRLHIWDMATGRELLTLATMVGNNVGRIQFEGDRIHLRASKYRILDGRPVKD